MPNFNTFADQGLFNTFELTASVNRIPYAPRLIQALNLYQEKPVNTNLPIVERRFGSRQILASAPFGVRNNVYDIPNRTGHTVKTWSANISTLVTKQDVVGVRRFGEINVETIGAVVADRMEWMRQDAIESTIESWRMQSLLGTVTDPDGSELINWYNFFGVTPTTINYVSATDGTATLAYCKRVKDAIQDALQGVAFTGFIGILGDNAWAKLFQSAEMKDLYKYRQAGSEQKALDWIANVPGSPNPNSTSISFDSLANVFTYGGITFLNYRASVDFPTDKAVFLPTGVRDMFQSILSPSSMVEEQGEMGQPFYALTWPKDDGSGIGVYVESNRIEANLFPEATIQATFS